MWPFKPKVELQNLPPVSILTPDGQAHVLEYPKVVTLRNGISGRIVSSKLHVPGILEVRCDFIPGFRSCMYMTLKGESKSDTLFDVVKVSK
jgi:hypothetical protein